jgi:hypothetical protein
VKKLWRTEFLCGKGRKIGEQPQPRIFTDNRGLDEKKHAEAVPLKIRVTRANPWLAFSP